MDRLFGFDKLGEIAARVDPQLLLGQEVFSEARRRVLHRGDSKGFAIEQQHMPELCTAQAQRIPEHGFEIRLQLADRA